MRACAAGLASGIEDALDLSPAQMLECLNAAYENQNMGQREGTPEEFMALAGAALGGADGVEVIRG